MEMQEWNNGGAQTNKQTPNTSQDYFSRVEKISQSYKS